MRRGQMDGDTEMTEETAVRIAEALESIAGAIGMMEGLAVAWTIVSMIAFLFYIVTKD